MSTAGVRIGLRDVYYALLTTDDYATGVQYGTPVRIAGAITANINPNPSLETLFADDGPMEVAATLGNIELELNLANIPTAVRAALLGHTISDGKLVKKSTDTAPWVALGFRALKSNGNYKYVWLVKGKFSPSAEDHATRGDTVEFQTPTINGSFVKRDFDDVYEINGDTDDVAFTSGMAAAWFTAATIGDLSTFDLLASTMQPTHDVSFNLLLNNAKDYLGANLSGAKAVTVVSDDTDETGDSAVTTGTFTAGDATVAITLAQAGVQTLTVTVAGVARSRTITVEVA